MSRTRTRVPSAEYVLSPKEAAEMIGVNVVTVKRWLLKGWLKGLKGPGGWWKLSERDVRAFIDAHVQGTDY